MHERSSVSLEEILLAYAKTLKHLCFEPLNFVYVYNTDSQTTTEMASLFRKGKKIRIKL